MHKSVICISSEPGTGGEHIGRLVAKRLRLRYVDEGIVLRAAAEGRVSTEELLDVERRKPALERLFSGLREAALPEEAPRVGFEDRDRALIRAAVHATADEGGAVIHAHAASVALGARPDVLRILITASPETRERRVAEETHASESKARRLVRDGERGRASYLKTFYGVDRELPTHYDLVVNTDVLSDDEAAAIIVAAAS
jgi:cytidylate kinase